MKQYTTPNVSIEVPGKELLLAGADRVVASIRNGQRSCNIEGERLTIDGDTVSFRLTVEETAALSGVSYAEVTMFSGELVYKTETVTLKIDEAVWDNGE